MAARVGTAGWSVPAAVADRFPAEGTHLQRYAACFDAVEINSSFYRPHRQATYARWAASVPAGFRFAVKLPRLITHERRLVDCAGPLDRFADAIAGLADRRGPILVQLPPSFAFDAALAETFFALLSTTIGGSTVCEPRHPSWFADAADRLLSDHQIARVAADPARVPAAARPGGWGGLVYSRLHGSPRTYWSSYDEAAIDQHAATATRGTDSWMIYDNTASGAAAVNALALCERLA